MLVALHHATPADIADALLRHHAALELACRINPARASTAAAEALRELASVTQLQDLCENAPASIYQREYQGREPFVLHPDARDPFSFISLPILDKRAAPAACGRYWIDLVPGRVLLPGDTLVYWR